MKNRATPYESKEFLSAFKTLSIKHDAHTAWRGFASMAACTLSNIMPNPVWQQREDRYLSISKQYTSEELDQVVHLLAITNIQLNQHPDQDFLGHQFEAMCLHSSRLGQFFTPDSISHILAEFTMHDLVDQLQEQPFVSVCDPACGTGSTLIAAADVFRRQNINAAEKLLIVGQDVDLSVAMACYVQLSLLGLSAQVIVGDALSHPPVYGMPESENVWFTPAYRLNRRGFTVQPVYNETRSMEETNEPQAI